MDENKEVMKISYEDWIDKYEPIMDEDNPSSPLDCDVRIQGNGITTKQMDSAIRENRVWTLIDGDGDDYDVFSEPIDATAIFAGYRLVNRLQHYITAVPWEDAETQVLND